MTHDFRYVSKKDPQVRGAYQDMVSMLREVGKELKSHFTFQYRVVGSYSRNMITCDKNSNTGFDFDVNIYPNDSKEKLSAAEIRKQFRLALDKYCKKYKFANAEDSTRVLTVKVKDRKNSKVGYSIDFMIVNDYEDNRGSCIRKYIRFNKKQNSYTWEKQSKEYAEQAEMIDWIKAKCLWGKVRDTYLVNKNKNNNPDIHSRTVFCNTLHQICDKNGYND